MRRKKMAVFRIKIYVLMSPRRNKLSINWSSLLFCSIQFSQVFTIWFYLQQKKTHLDSNHHQSELCKL